MRLLCVKDSWSIYPNIILVKKGCYYHLIKVVRAEMFEGINNIWYVLLETGDYIKHHSSLFAIAPDDEIEEEVKEEQKIMVSDEKV